MGTAESITESTAERAPRKDRARNHDALLAAAAEVYDERGTEAPLDEIARRAGVGIATLYRHFPTRDSLNEAVYRQQVDGLCDQAADLLHSTDPVEALSSWMKAFAHYVARKRGMAMALKSALGVDNELFTYSHQRIRTALGNLLDAAVATGEIRSDIDQEDLIRAMSGICMATDAPGWAERTGRLIDLLLDGLRYGAPTPA